MLVEFPFPLIDLAVFFRLFQKKNLIAYKLFPRYAKPPQNTAIATFLYEHVLSVLYFLNVYYNAFACLRLENSCEVKLSLTALQVSNLLELRPVIYLKLSYFICG